MPIAVSRLAGHRGGAGAGVGVGADGVAPSVEIAADTFTLRLYPTKSEAVAAPTHAHAHAHAQAQARRSGSVRAWQQGTPRAAVDTLSSATLRAQHLVLSEPRHRSSSMALEPMDDASAWSTKLFPESNASSAPSSALSTARDSLSAAVTHALTAPAQPPPQPAATLRPERTDEDILVAAGWDITLRARLGELFRKYAGGRPEMTFAAFEECMVALGVRVDLPRVFAAFDRNNHGSWISDRDFLCGLAALDSHTAHVGAARQARAGYIFRFYSFGKKLMTHESFLQLVHEAVGGRPFAAKGHRTVMLSPAHLAQQLNPSGGPIKEADIIRLLCNDELPGANTIFRANFSAHARGLNQTRRVRIA